MSLTLLAAALVLLLLGAAGGAVVRAGSARLRLAGAGAAACGVGAAASCVLLLDGDARLWRVAWSPPIGHLALGVDALSAFFLLCIFAVGGLSMLYAAGYFADEEHGGAAIAWLQVLIAAMAMVALARDIVSFLVAWEAMFFASYFLVTLDADADDAVAAAGFTYLIASHISVVLLFVLFGLLARHAGGTEFAGFAAAPPMGAAAAGCFAVALAGFGIKAGVWPLHGWLPEAHPAAPSPVSALMSGVMVKMGVYGLLRTLTFLPPPPLSWGIAVLAVGAVSALAGILLALAQRDLKRLLAYSTVENVGIVMLGLGVGLLGNAAQAPAVAIAGFGGALLHTLNHGLFKGVLFQAAGAVWHATGQRELNVQGGLLRRMPATGLAMIVAALAIAGLPPLNGFVGEWLIYVGALRQVAAGGERTAVAAAAVVIPVLGLVGGLAAACFANVVGTVLLGEPRSGRAGAAGEVGTTMAIAMLGGAATCVIIGCVPSAAVHLVASPAALLVRGTPPALGLASAALPMISAVAGLLVLLVAVLSVIRLVLLRRNAVETGGTWGCGYATPTPRMQYTADSFAQPLLEPFIGLLHARVRQIAVTGLFPQHGLYDRRIEDPGEVTVRWGVAAVAGGLTRLRALQRGPVQLYVLYVLLTLLALLVWQVGL